MDFSATYLDLSHQGLTSLPDLSQYKNLKELDCSYNQLKSLQGCPNSVIKLYCDNNQLTSLQGCPNSVIKLNCSDNQLTSLQGCPNSVIKLYCDNNQLTSLQGCSNSVTELYCYYNQLTSLRGCPNSITILNCDNNQLTSLQGCPNSVIRLYCYNNQLKDFDPNDIIDKIRAKNRMLGLKLILEQYRLVRREKLIKRFASKILDLWLTPDQKGECGYSKYMSRLDLL